MNELQGFGLKWTRVRKRGRSFSRKSIFHMPPSIGNSFPLLSRKMLMKQESVFMELFRTKHMKNEFSPKNRQLFHEKMLYNHAFSLTQYLSLCATSYSLLYISLKKNVFANLIAGSQGCCDLRSVLFIGMKQMMGSNESIQ